ncbi:hypothetical protein SUDANB6_03425 [Streptomyces sp. enrichment culture]
MNARLSRTVGIVTMAVGIVVAAWVLFGPPRDWAGDMRWVRHGLALGSLGAISLSVRLMSSGTDEDESRTT